MMPYREAPATRPVAPSDGRPYARPMGRVVHFEIHAADCDRAERFYTRVFGWEVRRWEGAPVDYR